MNSEQLWRIFASKNFGFKGCDVVDFSERTRLAEELARRAGERVLEIQKGDMGAKAKGINDVVTIADFESEKIITEAIYDRFCDDGMIAEEGSRKDAKSGYVWVADPVDGTVNYSRGMPLYAVSVGYMKDGVPEGGAVYIPKLDEMFVCERGKGAWMNGERIRVSERDLKSAIAVIDYHNRTSEHREWLDKVHKNLTENIVIVNKFSSAVIELCFAACGRVEISCIFGLWLWDYMPSGLLLEEAGGRFTQMNGSEVDYSQIEGQCVMGTNGVVHEEVLGLVGM